MTKEELLLQIKTINMRIKLAQDSLDEMYMEEGARDEEFLKKEAKLLKEIKSLKKIKKDTLELEPDLESDILAEPKEEIVSEAEYEKIEKETKNKNREKGLSLVIAVLSVTLIISILSKNCQKKKPSDSTPTATPSATQFITSLPTESPTIIPEVEKLFSDVNDETQLIKRAKEIYNLDLKPILEELNSEQMNEKVTENNLMDMIRLGLGELPLIEEYGPNTLDEMYQFRTEVFGNLGSDPNLTKLYPVHYSLLTPENSEISEYVKSYDEIYNAIAEARNNNDMESAIKNIQELGKKHYNEWVLAGLYGGYNPYMLDSEHKQLALAAADERYASYVLEYILNNNLTICVPACYDPITGEFKEINVVDIEEAIMFGTSMNGKVSLSYYGDKQDIALTREFYYLLENELNSKVLKRG